MVVTLGDNGFEVGADFVDAVSGIKLYHGSFTYRMPSGFSKSANWTSTLQAEQTERVLIAAAKIDGAKIVSFTWQRL